MIDWLIGPWPVLGYVLASTLGIYIAIVLLTRISGLRSFSKISGFDFAVTVAIGSVMATVLVAKEPPLLQGMVALAALYTVQLGTAILRYRWSWFSELIDNEPLLLMDGQELLYDNLHEANVSEADIRAKLREANVITMEEVRAVVMETTGDISVLHGPPDGLELEASLMEGVRRTV